MGLYYPALLKSIGTRLQADTTLVGYMGGSDSTARTLNIATTFPKPAADPRGTTYPFVCIWPVSDVVDDTFDGRKLDLTFEVHAFTEVQPTTTDSTLLKLVKIHERIVGDWASHSDRVPVYGLDRFLPDFTGYTGDAATAYSATHIEYKGFQDLTDPIGDRREWVMTFDVSMTLES